MAIRSFVAVVTICALVVSAFALPAPPPLPAVGPQTQPPGVGPSSPRVAKDLQTDASIALGYAVPAVGYTYGYGYPYSLGYSYGYALGYPSSYYWGYPYYYY